MKTNHTFHFKIFLFTIAIPIFLRLLKDKPVKIHLIIGDHSPSGWITEL